MDIEFSPIVVVMLVIASAFVMVMILSTLRWPTVPAYFIAGMAVGPSGIGALHSNETAHFIAELGIIFSLFTIGIKFSLAALRTIRRHVFWLGGSQTIFTAILFGAPVWWFTKDPLLALLLGSVAAMSSTAVISQSLIDDNMLSSPVGNRAMGVLLFQDLAVIPLIIIFSAGNSPDSLLHTGALVALKVAVIMVLVLYAGAPLMSRWLNFVSGYGGKELYMLNLIMIIAVMSGLSALSGLSFALGAFIAGILMSETLHRHRVTRIVEPFRHIFLGFFFVSLGILVDPVYVLNNLGPILAAAVVVVILKGLLVFFCAKTVGSHAKTAIYVSLLVCGTGEFGFVMLTIGESSGIVEAELFQFLLSANLVALMGIPFMWRQREFFSRKLAKSEWLTEAKNVTDNLAKTMQLSDHVIIGGYGRTGQAIAGILRDLPIPYIALEENYQILRTVGGADNVIYAEASAREGLIGAGIDKARVVIIAFIDSVDSRIAVQQARQLNSKILIIARADTVAMADELIEAGATRAFVDAHEFGFSAANALASEQYGVPSQKVTDCILRARRRENLFFTGEFGGAVGEDTADASTFSGCIARKEFPSLRELLDDCELISWTRGESAMDIKELDRPVRVGDELVLIGSTAKIAAIREKLGDSRPE